MEDFTIIDDDEDIIGKVIDIKKCFLSQLKNDLADNNIDVEDKITQLDLVQDLIKKINELNDNTIIKVHYNPMGEFNFKYLNWEE